VDERTLEIYNNSFEACLGRPDFLPRFYSLFLGSSPAVAKRFVHTDLPTQCRILKKSLYVLTLASTGTAESGKEIERLGKSHGRDGMNIPPEMYDLWLSCLLRAVSEFDPAWNSEVEASWRRMFGVHLSKLKRHSEACNGLE
jgi:hemoglobin-like flavoprotein